MKDGILARARRKKSERQRQAMANRLTMLKWGIRGSIEKRAEHRWRWDKGGLRCRAGGFDFIPYKLGSHEGSFEHKHNVVITCVGGRLSNFLEGKVVEWMLGTQSREKVMRAWIRVLALGMERKECLWVTAHQAPWLARCCLSDTLVKRGK